MCYCLWLGSGICPPRTIPLGPLFPLFENTISYLVTNGKLVHFNEQGELVSNVEKLYLNREEIELLTESLRAGFNGLEQYCIPLPAVSYGTSKDSKKDFIVDDEPNEIFKSTHTNGYTYIYKSKGFNTAQLNSYKGVLSKSYKEKQELQAKLDALEKEHAQTLRQKKQYKFVLILFVVLLGCAVGLFSLNDNLNHTRHALSNAENIISMQNDSLNARSRKISDLCLRNDKLNTLYLTEIKKRTDVEKKYEGLQKIVTERQPFIIKKTSFKFATGYLTIEYYGLTEGSVDIQVKAYRSGEAYSNTASIYVYKGDNTATVYLSSRLNGSEWYSFEILQGNVIIGGSRH